MRPKLPSLSNNIEYNNLVSTTKMTNIENIRSIRDKWYILCEEDLDQETERYRLAAEGDSTEIQKIE